MTATRRRSLETQPARLDLGSHYVGARIAGSVQVLDANTCERVYDRD